MGTTGGFTLSWGSCSAEGCWMCWVCGSPGQLKELFSTHSSTAKSLSCLTAFPDGLSLIPRISWCEEQETWEQAGQESGVPFGSPSLRPLSAQCRITRPLDQTVLLAAVRALCALTGPCCFVGVIFLGKHPVSSSRQPSSNCYLLQIYLAGVRRVEMFEVWTAVKVVSGRVGKWWIAAWEH